MKCELCHERNAKHQWFDQDNHELYICHGCYVEKTTPQEDCFEYFEDRDETKSPGEAVVSTLVELRKAVGHPTSFTYVRDIEDMLVDAKCLFDQLEKKITLSFSMVGQSEEEGEDEKETRASWTFDVSDKDDIRMSGKVHYGNEHTTRETEYRFKDFDGMPKEAQAVLLFIVSGLTASRDELKCQFD